MKDDACALGLEFLSEVRDLLGSLDEITDYGLAAELN